MSDTLILGLFGLIVSLIAIVTPIIRLNTKIVELGVKLDNVEEKMDKHNNLVERTAVLERDLKTNWTRVDELKAEVREIKKAKA